jgi:hypothetical protein
MGAEVELALPVSVVPAGYKLNITAVTLGPRLQIAFLAMPDAVQQLEKLARLTEQAFDELKAALAPAAELPAPKAKAAVRRAPTKKVPAAKAAEARKAPARPGTPRKTRAARAA